MLLNRNYRLQVGELVIQPPLFMEFSYITENDNLPAILEINIYNLSEDNINLLNIGQGVSFNFGYDNDIGELSSGYVVSIITTPSRTDNITTIKVVESSDIWNEKVSVVYNRYTLYSYVIQDLANKAGLFIKKLDLLNDGRYPTGYSSDLGALDQIRKIVSKSGSEITVKGNSVFIYNENTSREGNILLDFTSGLLKEPLKNLNTQERDYDFSITSLPIHYLKKGDIFQVDANKLKAIVKIVSFSIRNWEAVYKVKVVG